MNLPRLIRETSIMDAVFMFFNLSGEIITRLISPLSFLTVTIKRLLGITLFFMALLYYKELNRFLSLRSWGG